jgi:hypothetical protein
MVRYCNSEFLLQLNWFALDFQATFHSVFQIVKRIALFSSA